MFERLATLVFRWRHLVLTVEILMAGVFLFVGWRGLQDIRAQVPATVAHTVSVQPGGAARGGGVILPPSASPAPSPRGLRGYIDLLTPGMVGRLNNDDLQLYREQWRAVRAIVDGLRGYLEQRVIRGSFTRHRDTEPGLSQTTF